MIIESQYRGYFQVSLLLFLATYLIYPHALPIISISLHGLILGLVFLLHIYLRFSTFSFNYSIPFIVFCSTFGLAVLWSFEQVHLLENVKPIILGVIAAYLIGIYFRDAASFQRLCYFGLFVIVPLAIFSLVQTSFGCLSGIGKWLLSDQGILALRSMHNPMVYGIWWLIGTAVLLYGLENHFLSKSSWVLFVPLFFSTALTPSRAVWFGMMILLSIYFGVKKQILYLIVLLATFLIVTMTLPKVTAFFLNDSCQIVSKGMKDIKAKTTVKKLVDDSGMHGRWGIVNTAVNMWSDYPIFGVGPGNFPHFSSTYAPSEQRDARTRQETHFAPHNIFVALLAETGLVGLVGFVSMLGMVLGQFYRHYSSVPKAGKTVMVACLALFSSVVTVGLAQDLLDDRIWWIGFGLFVGSSHYDE